MPIPTNTSALTATPIVVGTPFTQQVDNAGTTYTVWYSFIGPTGTNAVNCFGFGDLITYRPTITIYDGPAAAPVLVPPGISNQNKPIQVPTIPGNLYLIRITPNGVNPAPANLTLTVTAFTIGTVVVNSICIPDDTDPLPMAILSPTTAEVVKFVPFPKGEGSANLDDGTIFTQDDENVTGQGSIYDSQFNLITSLVVFFAVAGNSPREISTNKTDTFYVGIRGNGLTAARIAKISKAGVILDSWILSSAGLLGIVPSPNESIIYVVGQGGLNTTIKRWDVVTDAFISDLVGAVSGSAGVAHDLLCSSTGLVVESYTDGGHTYLRGVSALGVVDWTTDLVAEADGDFRMCRIPNNTISFLGWLHLNSGFTRIKEVRYSDGVVINTLPDRAQYETAAYEPAETATPADLFGHSFSCPIFVTTSAVVPPVVNSGGGIYFLDIGKRNDTLWIDTSLGTTRDVKIP